MKSKNIESKLNRGKEQLAETLNLPKDIVLGASIVTIMGTKEVFIENYKGLLEYHAENIVLQGKTCKISINGKRLNIDYYTNEDMRITGHIDCVKYLA